MSLQNTNIIQEIKEYVKNECEKPTNKYGYDAFLFHFVPMVKYAEKLADELGGDKEVILIASWLHDIGSIVHGRKDHHITGAKIAEEKLRELNYPEERIELVKRCILHHRGSQQSNRVSIEEQIVAEADVLSNFDNITGIFYAAFKEGKNQSEAKDDVRRKLENKWKQLHFENSRKLIKGKYEAAILLLK